MSTKERIANEKERKAIERELDEILLPINDSLKKLFDLEHIFRTDPKHMRKSCLEHMLKSDLEDMVKSCLKQEEKNRRLLFSNFISFDVDGNPWRHFNIGKGGNEQREDDKRDRAKRLKIKYPDDWGTRGGAGRIFRKEAKLYEQEIAEGKTPLTNCLLSPKKKKGVLNAKMLTVKAEKLTEGTIRRYFNDFP
jgi:hypothetical protein